jgi:hypothetical protein
LEADAVPAVSTHDAMRTGQSSALVVLPPRHQQADHPLRMMIGTGAAASIVA